MCNAQNSSPSTISLHCMLIMAAFALCGCQGAGVSESVPRQGMSLRGQIPASSRKAASSRGTAQAHTALQRAIRDYHAGKLEDARKAAQEARRIDPYNISAYEIEARIAFDLGRMDDYVAALDAALSANPTSPRLQNRMGNRLMQAGQANRGLDALKEAVRLSPRKAGYAKDLAAAYLQQERIDEAVDTLRNASRRLRQDRSLSIALARLYESTKQWTSAVDAYDRVLQASPNNISLRRKRAHCLYHAGQYKRASQDFAVCQSSDEQTLSLSEMVQFGDASLRTGDFRQAQQLFDEISNNSPHRSRDVEVLRGLCALKRGDKARARGILTVAATQWPRDAKLQSLLAVCTEAVNTPSQAVARERIADENVVEAGFAQEAPSQSTNNADSFQP